MFIQNFEREARQYATLLPVWKERISYARYFLSAFSSHANS